ncbi:VOC family protein [bacterium]|nr:VOC family protein [bacterium]
MLLLNHIAIIASSNKTVDFYKELGFIEKARTIRPECHDELIYLSNGLITLEIYVDSTHPKRLSNPEAYGLRHLCFQVESIEDLAQKYGSEIKTDNKGRFIFINDPDNQPIEIREIKPKSPNSWEFSE